MEFKVINSFKKSIVFKNIFNDHKVVSIILKWYKHPQPKHNMHKTSTILVFITNAN